MSKYWAGSEFLKSDTQKLFVFWPSTHFCWYNVDAKNVLFKYKYYAYLYEVHYIGLIS